MSRKHNRKVEGYHIMKTISVRILDRLANIRIHLQVWSFDLEGDDKERVKKIEDDILNMIYTLTEIRKSVRKKKMALRF